MPAFPCLTSPRAEPLSSPFEVTGAVPGRNTSARGIVKPAGSCEFRPLRRRQSATTTPFPALLDRNLAKPGIVPTLALIDGDAKPGKLFCEREGNGRGDLAKVLEGPKRDVRTRVGEFEMTAEWNGVNTKSTT